MEGKRSGSPTPTQGHSSLPLLPATPPAVTSEQRQREGRLLWDKGSAPPPRPPLRPPRPRPPPPHRWDPWEMRAPHLSNIPEIYDLHCSKLNSSGGDTWLVLFQMDGRVWRAGGPMIPQEDIMFLTTAINHVSVSLDHSYPRHIWRRRD